MAKRIPEFNFSIRSISRFSGTPLIRTTEVDYNDTYTGEDGTLTEDASIEDGYSLEDTSATNEDAGVEFEIYDTDSGDTAVEYDTTTEANEEEYNDEIIIDMDYIDEFEEYYTEDPCEAYMTSQGEGSFGING